MTDLENEWPGQLLNRELSWLDFNARVLAIAEDPGVPLFERCKFLAIFASGLDEFYMVRVAGLKRQIEVGLASRSPDGLTPREQLEAIGEKVAPLAQHHATLFSEEILPALANDGVRIARWKELRSEQRKELEKMFREHVFPVVTPLAVDPAHPFPYISNLSLNLAVLVRDPADKQVHFARVKVPPLLPRFSAVVDGSVFVPLEDVIAANIDKLFPGMEVVAQHTFRVTRNVDVDVSDGADDLLQALEEELRRRRFSPAVRLEIEQGVPPRILKLLKKELQIEEADVHTLPGPLDLSALWDLYGLERPKLKDPPFQAVVPTALVGDEYAHLFEVLKKQDLLVHHPYESFTASVQRFIEEAAADPDVLAIKQTLYRTSGESPIVDALIEAAQAGKQVVVLVEIKARFDEQANIRWARALEQAGCHVVYGLVGLKTHCKLALVVRQEGKKIQRYVHVGTGNYNPKTARQYEDLGLLTADKDVGADVSELFNYLTGYARQPSYRALLVSPHGMREQLTEMIEREAKHAANGEPNHIVMKVNSLVDRGIIEALYSASQAGVPIDLIVRGICSLRPGVEGLSSTITVRSILGRFLEHSRVFYFENGGEEEFYMGSADIMERNLDRRVEALARVKPAHIKTRLRAVLKLALADNTSAWHLDSEGNWDRRAPHGEEITIDLQAELSRRVSESDA